MSLLRCKFTKEDDIIYISHLDTMKMIERALRRAKIKLSFSQGFNPHPKMAFAQALSLGVISLAEYMDVEIEEDISCDEFLERINAVLPAGVRFLSAKVIDKKETSLMASVDYSRYAIEIEGDFSGLDSKVEIEKFMKNDEIINLKKTKKGAMKEINIRPMIKDLAVLASSDDSILFNAVIQTSSAGNLKPEVLMKKITELTDMEFSMDDIRIQRLEMYKNTEDGIKPLI